MKKSRQRTHPRTLKNAEYGIPEALASIHYEKTTQVIPVKVQLSLKFCLKRIAGKQGVSPWVRGAILEKLERIKNE